MKPLALLLAMAITCTAVCAGEALQGPRYEPYVLAPGEGLVNGLTGRLKANGRSTQAGYSVVVRESKSRQAAEPHTHSHLVEAWYVVEGAMQFQSLDAVIDAPTGTFVLIAPAVEHSFKTLSEQPIKLVQIFSPPGFENLFSERLALPSYDSAKELGAQSAQWKADQKEIARKYGAGPAERVANDLPWVVAADTGNVARQLAPEEVTDGRYVLEESSLAGGRPSKKSSASHFDEAWYVLAGELHFSMKHVFAEWRDQAVPTGGFVFVPRETPYKVWATTPGARFLHWQSQPRRQSP